MPVGGGFEGTGSLLYLASAAGVCSTTALIMYRHGRSLDFAGEEVRGRGGGRGRGEYTVIAGQKYLAADRGDGLILLGVRIVTSPFFLPSPSPPNPIHHRSSVY